MRAKRSNRHSKLGSSLPAKLQCCLFIFLSVLTITPPLEAPAVVMEEFCVGKLAVMSECVWSEIPTQPQLLQGAADQGCRHQQLWFDRFYYTLTSATILLT
jgi:hypothetical protein